eukprot:365028-Chlamydomonas_euryale.AAC.54
MPMQRLSSACAWSCVPTRSSFGMRVESCAYRTELRRVRGSVVGLPDGASACVRGVLGLPNPACQTWQFASCRSHMGIPHRHDLRHVRAASCFQHTHHRTASPHHSLQRHT